MNEIRTAALDYSQSQVIGAQREIVFVRHDEPDEACNQNAVRAARQIFHDVLVEASTLTKRITTNIPPSATCASVASDVNSAIRAILHPLLQVIGIR